MNDTRCKASCPIGDGFHRSRCKRAAKMDGYCKQHHPQLVADRRKARLAQSEATFQAKRAAWERQAAIPRKAAELCKWIVETNDVPEGPIRARARELLDLLDGAK